MVEKAWEYNHSQEEAFQSEEERETEGEENTDEEGENSQGNQGDSSQEVVQIDGSSERQKRRKVDFNPEVLETNNLKPNTKQVPLKERRLLASESEEGGKSKKPLTLDIAKAQKYSALTRTPTALSAETKESHFFRFQPSEDSNYIFGREKLGTYPQTLVRLDTKTTSEIEEETIAPLPVEVEKQLREEEELR